MRRFQRRPGSRLEADVRFHLANDRGGLAQCGAVANTCAVSSTSVSAILRQTESPAYNISFARILKADGTAPGSGRHSGR